jgi:hypothetical protein
MSLTYRDITNRQRNLMTIDNCNINVNVNQLLDSLKESYSYHKAKLLLENWTAFGNEDIALDKVFEVFTIITDNDDIPNIENASNIIEGNIITKLRNAKQTNLLNHYKRGWIKHRHTSMLNDTKDNENAVAKAKANGGYLGNSLHPNRKYKRDIYGRKMGEVKNTSSQQQDGNDESDNTAEVAKECFDRFINVAYVNEQCDRVLNNHQKLSKRFNFDNIVRQCPLSTAALQDCIYHMCGLLETYDMYEGVRYLISLENIMYLMNKNCVPVDNSFIVETVTDYFLMSEDTNIDVTIRNLKYVIENSKFFNDDELSGVRYVCTDNEDAIIEAVENEEDIDFVEENKIHDMFLKYKQKRAITLKKKQKVESLKIKKEIHDFKKSNKKTIENFKATISRIFVNSPEGIINELPDIFKFVRLGIVIGAFAINPYLGIITMITGFFLKMKISRERMAIVIIQYTKECDNYKKKMDKAKSNGDEKKREKYEKLYKQYKEDISKLESYQEELYTEAENEKRMEEKYAKEAEKGGDDFSFDDFDMAFDFEEQTAIEYADMMATLCEQLSFSKANLDACIHNNISKLSSGDIYNITEAVKLCNDIVDCPRFVNTLEDELARVRGIKNESYIVSLQRIDSIKMCMSDIEKIKYDSLLESGFIQSDNELYDIETIYETLKYKNEIINDTIDYIRSVNEAKEKDDKKGISFLSKLKIASQNLKRVALKGKDKDKELSMKLDSELNRTMKAVKQAMISDSRESIIKGSFLPSASKCLHIALASGAAFLIEPALAIVGLLGFIGCSKVLNEKERNLILDDIDIEIKMCDKYMKIAEEKDDLTAVREIMKTKRDLERQRSRILYNKKYVFKGKKQYDMKPASMSKNAKDDNY